MLELKRREDERQAEEQAARKALSEPSDNDDWDEPEDGGRSPNDDRSDSMNPNSDAHQAAMDNHANQMNPNNPAHGSSRGGRR